MHYTLSIKDYEMAIKLKDIPVQVYYNCGEAWLHLREWEKAKANLTTAKGLGVNIIAAFRKKYKSVADFEQETGIQLPEDIAAMLTPPQA